MDLNPLWMRLKAMKMRVEYLEDIKKVFKKL